MTDVVVSVRMPSSLVKELRILSETNHFKDLSEEIRSVVRERCIQYSQPYTSELKMMREELMDQLTVKKEADKKQQLIEDMKNIIEELKNEK